jgi:hypothetical protein
MAESGKLKSFSPDFPRLEKENGKMLSIPETELIIILWIIEIKENKKFSSYFMQRRKRIFFRLVIRA